MPPLPDGPRRPASLAALGALIADPVRAAILLHLSDGSRRPAGELAELAGASPQACSAHLAQLVEGGLLCVEPQGRFRFYRIESGEMAERLEDLANWVEEPLRRPHHDPGLCSARLCYDHLAGRLGVAVLDRMIGLDLLRLDTAGPVLSDTGQAWCRRNGMNVGSGRRTRLPLARLCLDWTERRHHLGGRLGAAIASRMIERDLLKRNLHSRAVIVTARGVAFLQAELGLERS